MKIVRVAACAAVMLALGSGVAVSQTQESQIVGAWNCHAETPESVVAGIMTYKADGTMDSRVSVTAKFEEGDLVIQVASTSSWKLLDGGLIEEGILSATATSATFNGDALPEADLASFGDGVSKDIGRSTVTVTEKQLVLIDGDDTVTACTR
jgi:hypothetical protein